jgi:hypothetical protein
MAAPLPGVKAPPHHHHPRAGAAPRTAHRTTRCPPRPPHVVPGLGTPTHPLAANHYHSPLALAALEGTGKREEVRTSTPSTPRAWGWGGPRSQRAAPGAFCIAYRLFCFSGNRAGERPQKQQGPFRHVFSGTGEDDWVRSSLSKANAII